MEKRKDNVLRRELQEDRSANSTGAAAVQAGCEAAAMHTTVGRGNDDKSPKLFCSGLR
jgi:hypothetical protein